MTAPQVVLPADGAQLSWDGITPNIVQKIRKNDLPGGHLGVIEGLIGPGELVSPHVHDGVDEVSYVLSGEITAEIGGEVVVAPTGSYILKPAGVMHAFWNSGKDSARIIELHLPGGFEEYYAEMAATAKDPDLDDTARGARVLALNAAHRVTHHPELVEDLVRRHGLVLPQTSPGRLTPVQPAE
jgi:mannose-6-phosphate isomerase-like protein (cupin superfamily)